MRVLLLLLVLFVFAGCTLTAAPPSALPSFMEMQTPIACQFTTGSYIRFTPQRVRDNWIFATDIDGYPVKAPSPIWINLDTIVYCVESDD